MILEKMKKIKVLRRFVTQYLSRSSVVAFWILANREAINQSGTPGLVIGFAHPNSCRHRDDNAMGAKYVDMALCRRHP